MLDLRLEEVCQQCGADRLRRWSELTAEEREVARRVGAPDDEAEVRRRRSLWCTRCWHEERNLHPRTT